MSLVETEQGRDVYGKYGASDQPSPLTLSLLVYVSKWAKSAFPE